MNFFLGEIHIFLLKRKENCWRYLLRTEQFIAIADRTRQLAMDINIFNEFYQLKWKWERGNEREKFFLEEH